MFDTLTQIATTLRAQNLAGLPDAHIEEDFAALQRGIESWKLSGSDAWPRSNGAVCISVMAIGPPLHGSHPHTRFREEQLQSKCG